MNGTHTEEWARLRVDGRVNKTPTVLVSGGSGIKRKVMAQQGSISSKKRKRGVGGVRTEGRTEQAEPWWR